MADSSASQLDPFAPPTANLDPRLNPDDANQPLADRGTRLGAAFLDGLLYTPLMIVGAGIGAALHSGPLNAAAFKSPASLIGIYAAAFLLCLPLAGYQWYLQSTTGQSLGKRWSRIKIVKKDGSPVNFVSAVLLRTWVPALAGWALLPLGLNSLSNVYTLLDALFIFGGPRRCLHDLIAGTKVIKLELV